MKKGLLTGLSFVLFLVGGFVGFIVMHSITLSDKRANDNAGMGGGGYVAEQNETSLSDKKTNSNAGIGDDGYAAELNEIKEAPKHVLPTTDELEPEPISEPVERTIEKKETVLPPKGEVKDKPTFPTATKKVAASDPPVIVAANTPYRTKRDVEESKPGYHFEAKAKTNENAELKYVLRSNETKNEFESTTGRFAAVLPTNSGVYTLVVTNVATGETTSKEVSGFTKVEKLAISELTRILNNPDAAARDMLVYRFFNTKSLVIVASGLEAGSVAPKSISSIWAGLTAEGWQVEVAEQPTYDEYNRITKLSIKINY